MLRPKPARWFEILAARDDATVALEALAATGAIELEARPSAVLPAALADLRSQLSEFAELSLRYSAYWPRTNMTVSPFPEPPATALQRSLAHLRKWTTEAEPVISQLQRGDAERAELLLWRRVLGTIGDSVIDFARLAGAGPVLHARLFVFPRDSEPDLPSGTLVRTVDLDHAMICALCALTVGAADEVEQLAQQTALLKGRVYDAPAWLRADAAETERYIAPRLDAIDRETERLNAELSALHGRHELFTALGDAHRLQWLIENVHALESGDLFCWITGWTSDFAGERLGAALERSGARALLHFPPAAPKAKAPMLLANPAWAKPFEIFSRALGMPARNEADPSILLAVAVPLMFGYMFGDVGQGLVIAAVGFALRRRFAIARLFIAGGLAAVFFGLLFGSVFSVHAFPAWWIEPLEQPLTILVAPLVGGAALLTVGLALNALEAWWRGEFFTWLGTDAGYVATYLGILAGFTNRVGYVVAAVGAVVFCVGHAFHARRLGAGISALAELAERLVQILVNTLSFARVGAFALAHAGL
ncbi:MAG: ATPase, partial [Casimicrobiaceae bacterium]